MIKEIKCNIKKELKQRNMTAQELCKKLGRNRKFIWQMTDEVKLNKIIDIADAIGCNVSELLNGF